MAINYNQTKRYIVAFNSEKFKPAEWEFKMGEHPTPYGNGSSVVILVNGEFRGLCDTRYDRGITKNFGKWCEEYLAECFDPKYEPKITEI